MKVSVITVSYNARATIAATLNSVLSQTGAEIEYLVVDGASTDGTVDLIRAAAERQAAKGGAITMRWISEPDRGLYDALNKGLALATGDIIGILNADDTFDGESTVADIVAAFPAEAEALYADIRFVRDGRTVRYYSARRWRPWMHRGGFMPPHPSVYIRRETFARLGGYKLGYRISADFELMVRYFCRARIRTAYLPRCVVRMLPGGLSTSGVKAVVRLNRENVRAERENGYWSCLAFMLPKYFYKVLGFVFRRGRREDGERRCA